MSSESKRLYIKIANGIVDQVSKGELKVGECILPERKLAEQLGVSRTVIREAMVYLEMLGIADIRKGAGVFIVRKEPLMSVGKPPEATPFEILDARLLIEPEIAKRAAVNGGEELVEELSRCVRMMESSMYFSQEKLRQQTSVDADRQFHKAINNACNNPVLIKFYRELMSQHMEGDMWMRMDQLAEEPAARGKWVKDHKAIFEAIKTGDAEQAYSRMREHILNVISEITE